MANSVCQCIAYGVVTRSLDTRTSDVVAVKQLLILPSERHNGIPITALREISILRSLKHQNIVNVLDVAVGEEALEDVYMVMEYCEQVGSPGPMEEESGFIYKEEGEW